MHSVGICADTEIKYKKTNRACVQEAEACFVHHVPGEQHEVVVAAALFLSARVLGWAASRTYEHGVDEANTFVSPSVELGCARLRDGASVTSRDPD